MKKLLMILPFLLPLAAFGQVSNPSIIPVASAPSGSCTAPLPIQLKTPDGTLYTCQNGTWGEISGGGGGSITLTTNGNIGAATLTSNVLNIPIYSAGLPFVTPESYGATGTGNTYFDGVIVSGTAAISSATASFVSGMVGDPICVAKAASGGGQMCGTITAVNSGTNVSTSFTPTASGSTLNFAFGTDDTTAWQTMLTTAPCVTTGCRINVGANGYVLTGSLKFPPRSTVVVSGAGPSIPNEANNFPSSLANSNSGSRWMFLTKSLSAGAVQFIGTNCSGCSSTSAPLSDRIENIAIVGGTGIFQDGGGNDGVVVNGWQSLSFVNDQVYGFTGRGYYIDGPGYIAGVKIDMNLVTYNGGAGIQVGSTPGLTGDIETVKVDSTVVEVNGGPGIWLDAPAGVIQPFSLNNSIIQWNNTAAASTEILISAALAACEINGNYFEVDTKGGSKSTAYVNNMGTAQGCTFHDNTLVNTALPGPVVWNNGTLFNGGTIAGGRIQNTTGNFVVDSSGNITGATITGVTFAGGSATQGSGLQVNSAVTTNSNIAIKNTSTGGKQWFLYTTGSANSPALPAAGWVGFYDGTDSFTPFGMSNALVESFVPFIAPSYGQTAASSTGGTCAMSTGTSCTITLGHTYTTPVCIVTQQSATLTGTYSGCTVSGTTVTITSNVANSETWGAFVFGNPN